MRRSELNLPMIQRLPMYSGYLRGLDTEYVSSTAIARALGLGEVQVRKDLGMISGSGKPKIGYETKVLKGQLENILNFTHPVAAIVIGAGKLGEALLGYSGFTEYGVQITAAFDMDESKTGTVYSGKQILPMSGLTSYCLYHGVGIAIIAVPAAQAQDVCDKAVSAGVKAIWNFAPTRLKVPEDVSVRNENLAASVAMLALQVNEREQ